MTNTKRSIRLAGAIAATAAAAALLTGCEGVSASPVGGNLYSTLPVGGATTGGPATAAATTEAAVCVPQTANVASDTAAQLIQTVAAEIPKGCGFTLSGTLESPAEAADGAQLQGNATYDGSGTAHFALLDQGMVLDTYVTGGQTDLRLYEAASPNATPDGDVKSFWQPAFSATSVSTIGSTKWVELTSAQLTQLHLGQTGIEGFSTLSSASALAADLTNGAGEAWTLDGSKTVNGIPCILVNHAAKGTTVPKTAIAIDKATGQPVQVSYAQSTQVILATFSNWGTTPAITGPTAVVDGSTLD